LNEFWYTYASFDNDNGQVKTNKIFVQIRDSGHPAFWKFKFFFSLYFSRNSSDFDEI